MSVKFFIYIFVSIVVAYSMDSLNINQIFKKNQIFKARLFYLFLGLSLIYLVTNFVYDFFISIKII